MAGNGVTDRHASLSYKRRQVDLTVNRLREGSYIAVVVHDPASRGADRLVEYITDAADFDTALGAGIEIARELIDEPRH